jgi:hypothetical protein
VIGDFGIGTAAAPNLRRLPTAGRLRDHDRRQRADLRTEEEYRSFVLGPLRNLIATKPFWERRQSRLYYNLANYKRFFALPNGGLHYSFTYGGVLFWRSTPVRFDAAQRRWLRGELRRSALAAGSPTHHPLWSSGRGYRSTRAICGVRVIPILQGGVTRAQRPHAELRALEAAALGPPQPARHRVRRDGRRRGKPEPVRHAPPAEMVGAQGHVPPPAAHPGRAPPVPRQRDRRRRQHARPVRGALPLNPKLPVSSRV